MKIVVHGTNWIGDAVMSVPALRALRNLFPKAHLTLYTRSWTSGIFRDCAFFDEILSPEEKSNKSTRFFSEVKLWKKERFDLAILFTNSFRTALIAKLGGARQRFGYANEGRAILLTKSIPKPSWKNTKHEVFHYLHLIKEVEKHVIGSETIETSTVEGMLDIAQERRISARESLVSMGVDKSKPIIGLGVGSQNSNAKRWPPKRFASLADRLTEEFGANLLLFGSASEVGTSNAVAKASTSLQFDLTGKTSLDEAVALLSELDMFVSNDMGLAHISSAVGTRTLTVFGPTNPLTTQPWNGEIIRREDVDCSPCMLRDCPIDHRCMTRIEVDDVFQRVSTMLSA